ncbi:MAG: lipoyl synthase [Proteobacteria bacterium]|nr:lipoyl synthase [Pseudomonadota bacterium]
MSFMTCSNYKKKIRLSGLHEVKKILRGSGLHTVCEEARCPNIDECFSKKTATFMIMGDVCTRACRFCNVTHGKPMVLDKNEPIRIAEAASSMGLKHVVITSVTRDDILDGGAEHFYKTITETRKALPSVSIEVLTPDFKGNTECIDIVLKAKPDVFNHNIETVKRLSKDIRPQADYERSLSVLKHASSGGFIVKSGFMLGLGEENDEIYQTMKDLRDAGVSILTVGQYFNPSGKSWSVKKYYEEDFFNKLKDYGKMLGSGRASF